jgi:hypothetical protein
MTSPDEPGGNSPADNAPPGPANAASGTGQSSAVVGPVRATDLEVRKHEADVAFRERAMKLQERELEAKLAEPKPSQWTNPLVLAVFGALITGMVSVINQVVTSHSQHVEDVQKHKVDMETEVFKAEASRILEAIKPGDPDRAACTLTFLYGAHLITTPNLREFLDGYLASRPGGSGVANGDQTASAGYSPAAAPQPTAPAGESNATVGPGGCPPMPGSPFAKTATPRTNPSKPTPVPAPPTPASFTFPYATDWMDGGHNQNEACDRGIRENQAKYPGKTLARVSSSEESRRTGFMNTHVEYKYYCTISVPG